MSKTDSWSTPEWLDYYYKKRGWSVIPITAEGDRKKHAAPKGVSWPTLQRDNHPEGRPYTDEEWHALFKGKGMGVILGQSSGFLVDIDLDTPEAIQAARHILPTTLRSGRLTAPRSHYWFRSTDLSGVYKPFQDPRDTTMLMEVRGTPGHYTIIPPSIHKTGEQYTWWGGQHDAEIYEDGGEVRSSVALTAIAALVAREARTWNARHLFWLHFSGALMRHTPSYWNRDDNLVHYMRVIGEVMNYHDMDDLLTTTRGTVNMWNTPGGKTTGWASMRDDMGFQFKGFIDALESWLEWGFGPQEKATEEAEVVIEPADIKDMPQPRTFRTIVSTDYPPIQFLIDGILQENDLTVLSGQSGAGKTMLSLWMVHEVARKGHHVLYIDEENSERRIGQRLRALGYTEEGAVSDRIHYFGKESVNLRSAVWMAHLKEIVERLDIRLVVLDSMLDLFVLSGGGNENDNTEVAHFIKAGLEPLKDVGAAILLHDHVGKGESKSTRGASIKQGMADHRWHLEKTRDFTKVKDGEISISSRMSDGGKSRDGALEDRVVFKVLAKVTDDGEPLTEIVRQPRGTSPSKADSDIDLTNHQPSEQKTKDGSDTKVEKNARAPKL